MVKLSERKVVAFFVGENVDLPRLSAVAHSCRNGAGGYSDCIEYAINVSSLQQTNDGFVPSYRDLKNPDLMLLLYLRSDTIVGARVFKYRTLIYPEGMTSGYETAPSQADIQQVARVLEFVVHKREREGSYESN